MTRVLALYGSAVLLLLGVALLFAAIVACFLLVPHLFGDGLFGVVIAVATAAGVCLLADRI